MLAGREVPHTLRVAVDGPDAAGKTRLTADLAAALAARHPAVPVVRVSMDDFHRPRVQRQQRGPLSPEGYYLDAFDHEAFVTGVLRPLGPGGDGWYRTAAHDLATDRPVDEPPRRAEPGSVLLVDGVFLLRPELRDHWDCAIYLHVEPAETLRRAQVRDERVFGSREAVRERYAARYLPGQELYRARGRPLERADVVLDLTDPLRPAVLRRPERG
nr:uridine kinase [Actinopolymorpha cephalotaxi]